MSSIQPKKKKKLSDVISIRLNNESKTDFDHLRKNFKEFSDSEILRSIIRWAAIDVMKKNARKK